MTEAEHNELLKHDILRLEQENAELQSENVKAKLILVEFEKLAKENTELRKNLELWTDQYHKATELVAEKSKENTALHCEIEKLNREADSLKEQCLLVDRANTGLEADIEQLRIYLDDARTDNAALKEQNARLVAMLEKLQWNERDYCCVCHMHISMATHTDDCPLGNLLKEVKNEV